MVDNALDACEEADIAPEITVTADECGITVKDNGPGIPEDTLKGAMDFSVRCSNREMYVAPDRGAQGNALMTLLSMPYILDPDDGRLVIDTRGARHDIVCRAEGPGRIAAVLRVAGESLQRQYGAAAGQLLYEALDDAEREIERAFGGGHDVTNVNEEHSD
ncbi:MAG: hypothetical protein A2W31_18105 [Planctomycetes bacterium RBG_16_64_10]|nr:MAG: hypothetical protein A2W31_18105 [Planctomycetes bacterium RBG_16_64_10]